MAAKLKGRQFAIPRSRRLTWDLLHFNRRVPLCGHDRLMLLSELNDVRRRSSQRISWPALFLKAYGLLAAEVPELRQTWYRWPFAHLYEHPCSIASIAVQRSINDEPWLFWGQIREPEHKSLIEIQQSLDELTTADPYRLFYKQIQLSSLPTIVRRLVWGWNLGIAKAGRARRIGTFFLSTLSGRGVEIQTPPSVQTGCLTYGPLSDKGLCRVTLAYDHRVMDGAIIADCLNRMEVILSETLRSELLNMSTTLGDTAAVA
ncbi:MAG: hypothetical protein Fues2KO_39010 [Fuerstiella sp.]